MVSFKNRLEEYMEDRHIKQTDLVDRIGRSKQVVSNWVNGKSGPRIDDYQELARKMNVSLVWLMGNPNAKMNVSSDDARELEDLMNKKIEDQSNMDNAPKIDINGSMFPVYTKEQLDKRMGMLQQALDMFSEGKLDKDTLELIIRSLR